MAPSILSLKASGESLSLVQQLTHGLRDGQDVVIPGNAEFAYSRSITTQSLYSDEGLAIYAEITGLKECTRAHSVPNWVSFD